MRKSGSTDNMCGTYSYAIQAPPKVEITPMALQDQVCNPKPSEAHGDISWNDQGRWAKWLCDGQGTGRMKAGDTPITWTPTQWDRDAFLTYTISWVEGCKTTVDAQDLKFPVEGTTCQKLLREDYTGCESIIIPYFPVIVVSSRPALSVNLVQLASPDALL